MKYPRLNFGGERVYSINDVSGGVNKSRSADLINDNELSDVLNMWHRDGMLKKRPSISKICNLLGYSKTDVIFNNRTLLSKHSFNNLSDMIINLALLSGEDTLNELPVLMVEHGTDDSNERYLPYTYFIYNSFDTIYIAVGFKNENDEFNHREIYTYKDGSFQKLSENEIYAPLVMINGKGNMYYTLPASDNTVFSPASTFESTNLLTDRVRIQFTTDGVSYSFPFTLERKAGTDVKIRFNGSFSEGEVLNEEITITDGRPAQIPGSSGIYCRIKNYNCIVFTRAATGAVESADVAPLASNFSGNLEIEFFTVPKKESQSFYEMSMSCWFGGSGGTGKGNRLFICGDENNKNILRWSDLNNPLYFPENNYAAVSSDAILAIKKQSNMLVIFSKNEIHYAVYVGGEFSAQDILAGTVTDIAAVSAVFPITQISGNIGIYSKNTIAMYNNSIVFLGSDRQVYMLSGTKLIKLSENISTLLLNTNDAFSFMTNYLDGFILKFGEKLYAYFGGWYIWQSQLSFNFAGSFNAEPVFCDNTGIYGFGGTEDFEFYAVLKTISFGEIHQKKHLVYLRIIGDGGRIEIAEHGTGALTEKPNLCGKMFIGLKNVESFSVNLKNVDNIERLSIIYSPFLK